METQRLDERLIERLAQEPLDETSVAADPMAQFRRWYRDAGRAGIFRADAMHLATADAAGLPAGRFVLYKEPERLGLDGGGLPFFTNYQSAKSREMEGNPRVALTFYWKEVGRQVRVRGRAERLPEEVCDRYFGTRPEGSQIGAWASPQSEPIPGRAHLEERMEEQRRRFAGGPVPRPPHWGGFLVRPERVEFWQHRDDRLHDRILYELREDGGWAVRRLAP